MLKLPKREKSSSILFTLCATLGFVCPLGAIVFDEVSSLHVWITISSLANKDPNNAKALLFRQVELNWINAPLDDENDYIGLYLDSQPDDNVLPVSLHRLNGQTNGHIITDYYLPQIDFYNETTPSNSRLNSSPQIENSQNEAENEESTSTSSIESSGISSDSLISSTSHSSRMGTPTSSQLNSECIGYCMAYHSRNKILASNCLKTNPSWMRDLFSYISARSLPSLMLPGSHNSATYPRQLDKAALHMINKYQMNQDESIFNQLVYGIRHLDLRVGYSRVKQRPERLWIYHDIFRTEVSVSEVLEQVKRFLDMTSHEIIIVDFHRFTVGFLNENLSVQRERHAKLISLIYKKLGPYLVPSYLGQHAPLNEYVAMGKRVIIGYANKASIVGEHHSGLIALHHQGASEPVGSSSRQRKQSKLSESNPSHLNPDDGGSSQQSEGSNEASDSVVKQSGHPLSYSSSESHDVDSRSDDRGVGSRLLNGLKSFNLISNSFMRRSADSVARRRNESNKIARLKSSQTENDDTMTMQDDYSEDFVSARDNRDDVLKAALFFGPVRHLWPNKDTIEGLSQYMNETTCRKYFGELRSMMVELTPTVFGAISDKYDGNRRLAQQVNRPVTDWIRDRWLHCINIVASDYFLGNDIIRLSIYANIMRVLHRDVDLNSYGQCGSFRRVEHLLDKSKIPIQFANAAPFVNKASFNFRSGSSDESHPRTQANHRTPNDIIKHTSSDGHQILLKPLAPSFNGQSNGRERRDSFVDNVSDGFSNLVSSFKRLLNL